MKLEAVDQHNPIFIRVATVVEIEEKRLKINYDSWPNVYDVWFNKDSEDIYPIGWCQITGYPLTPPMDSNIKKTIALNTCPTPGCIGLGHIKGSKFSNHFR